MTPEQQRMVAMLGSTPSTIFGGVAPQRAQMLDLQSIPGMNNQLGMILSMALQPLIMQLTSSMGYAGLQFGGTQNLYDRLQAQHFFLESRKAIQAATVQDQDLYSRRLIGMARLAGATIGDQQWIAARAMAADIGKMAPILGDMMPDFFDELHGARGSAAIMARRIHLGGRYAFDPITGELGLRGETAGLLSGQLFEQLYGKDARLSDMKGFGAGRVGQLYDELQRRGLLGGGPVTAKESIEKLAKQAGYPDIQSYMIGRAGSAGVDMEGLLKDMTGDDPRKAIDRFAAAPAVKGDIVAGEATRIKDRLKNLIGTVSAMRDIFGDMGKHNAPIIELINGLQALTQGGLATRSPAELERIVRTTQYLSRTAGVSMEGMMQLLSRGAGMSDKLALDRGFSIDATHGAVAFGTAFGTQMGAVPGWKMPDKDTITSIDQSLRLTAARSDIANQFNATLRIAKEMSIKKGSEFEAMAGAIERGQMFYDFGGATKSVVKSFTDWQKLAADAGVSPEAAYAIRSHAVANQEYGLKFKTGELARMFQRDVDINPILQMSGDVAFLRAAGGDTAKASRLSARAIELLWGSDVFGNEVAGGLTAADRADPIKRREKLVAGLKVQAREMGLRVSDDQLREAAVRMWSDFEQRVGEYEPLRGYGGALGVFAAHDPKVLQRAQQHLARVSDQGQLASALAGIGRTGMLRRFVDMLETTDGTVSVSKIIGQVVGGVPKSELFNALGQFGDVYREYQAADPNTEEGRRRREELRTRLKELTTPAVREADRAGFATGGAVGFQDVEAAIRTSNNMLAYGPAEPGRAQAAASTFAQQAQGITKGLLWGDDDTLARLGPEGWKAVKASHKRWSELQDIANKNKVTLDELLSGSGKAASIADPVVKDRVKKLVEEEQAGLAKIGEFIGGTTKYDTKTFMPEVKAMRDEVTRLNSPQEMAKYLMETLGQPTGNIDPQIIAQLQDPAKRASADIAIKAFQAAKPIIAAAELDTKTTSHHEAIEALIGQEEFKRIQPLLDALSTGKFTQALASGADVKTEKETKVVLDGPLKVTGRVRMEGEDLVFYDVQTSNHRTPVEHVRA